MLKKAISFFTAILMLMSVSACSAGVTSASAANDKTSSTAAETAESIGSGLNLGAEQAGEMRDITTFELVKEMGYGINLGNTLEACGDWIGGKTPNDFERAWGSPTITQAVIQNYADSGFGVLRIPVAWSNMISDDGTYTIAPEYIDRVKEIVDWTLDTDMYAIINIH